MTEAHCFELGTDGPSAIVVGIDGSATSCGLVHMQRD